MTDRRKAEIPNEQLSKSLDEATESKHLRNLAHGTTVANEARNSIGLGIDIYSCWAAGQNQVGGSKP